MNTALRQFMIWMPSLRMFVSVLPRTTTSEWYRPAEKLCVPNARCRPSNRLPSIVTPSLGVASCLLHTEPNPCVFGSGVSKLMASAVSRVPPAASRNSLPEMVQPAQLSNSTKWLLFMRLNVIPEIVTLRLCPAMIPRVL